MNSKEKIALIRKGNELFNNGEIDNAIKIFAATGYKDGLARVGDYYYEKKQPLIAVKFYKKAGMHSKVNEIFERMMYALGQLIGEDKENGIPVKQENSIPVNFAPELKKAAEEILRKKN
jgi:hypothetical protein